MTGNVIGDEFDEFVLQQIKVRQTLAGSGYSGGINGRSPQVLNYLNNRNAWIKLASSVKIAPSFKEGKETLVERKLRKVFGVSSKDYGGKLIAKKAVLFNTIQGLTQEDENTAGTFNPRKGVYSNVDNSFFNDDNIVGIGGTKYGPTPPPGIVDIHKTVLDKGSTEKLVINIKAYNTFQFELIELLYMRIGFFMMVEWGWDKYAYYDKNNEIQFADTGATVIDKYWFRENQKTGDAFEHIKDYREKYHGNYDGFVGKVQNMSYKLNSDLSYDITIELLGKGNIIESLMANKRTKKYNISENEIARYKGITELESGKILSNAGENAIAKYMFEVLSKQMPNEPARFNYDKGLTKTYYNQSLITAGKDFIRIPLYVNNNRNRSRFGNFKQSDRSLNSSSPAYDLVVGNADSDFNLYTADVQKYGENGRRPLDNPPNENKKFFVRFKTLLDFINKNIIPSYKNGAAKEPLTRILTTVSHNLVFLPFKNISFDANICIHTLHENFHSSVDNLSSDDVSAIEAQMGGVEGAGYYVGVFNPMKLNSTYMHEFDSGKLKGSKAEERGGGLFQIMNLYLNMNMVSEASVLFQDENGNVSLYDFLKHILQQINSAFGYTMKLMPYINEMQEIVIFNQNPALILEPSKLPTFDLAGYRLNKPNDETGLSTSQASIIRDFSFESKISPKMAQQMAIGAAAAADISSLDDGTMFGNMNQGLIDAYQEQFIDPNDNELDEVASSTYATDEAELTKLYNESLAKYSNETSWKTKLKIATTAIVTANLQTISTATTIASLALTSGKITDPVTGFTMKGPSLQEWLNEALEERKRQYQIAQEKADADNARLTIANDFRTAYANYIGGVPPLTNFVDGATVRNNQTQPVYGFQIQQFAEDDQTATQTKKLFQRYITKKLNKRFKKTGVASNLTGFIPVTADLTIDGLAGPKKLSIFSLDNRFVPINYPDIFNFLVQGLDHKVSNNDWETTINILSTPNMKPTDIQELIVEDSDAYPTKVKEPPLEESPPEESSTGSGENNESSTPSTFSTDGRAVKTTLPPKAVNLGPTWRNKTKRGLITLTGKEIWPILSGRTSDATEPVFWYPDKNGDPYAQPRADKDSSSKRHFYPNPEYKKMTQKFSALSPGNVARYTPLMEVDGKKTGLNMQESIKKTLAKLNQEGLNNDDYYNPSGRSIVSRDIARAKGSLSGHCFGLAIDVNPGLYPIGQKAYEKFLACDAVNSWSENLSYTYKGKTSKISYKEYKQYQTINIFKTIKHNGKNIWEWGGNFRGTKDAHHFILSGYIL